MYPKIAENRAFSPDSRVWIYIADRPLTEAEVAVVQSSLNKFVQQWTAHNQALKADGEVFQQQIIILTVDETQAGASGCSIDKSVHFLEQLGAELGVDFFERMRFGVLNAAGAVTMLSRSEFSRQRDAGAIQPDSTVINTLVQFKREFDDNWLLPYEKSWLVRVV